MAGGRKERRRGAAGAEEPKSKAQTVVDQAKDKAASKTDKRGGGGGADDKDILRALVEILAKLVLTNSADIRELCGAMFLTYLAAGDFGPGVAMLEAGVNYDGKAKELKKQKEQAEDAGEEGPDLAQLGPPFFTCG